MRRGIWNWLFLVSSFGSGILLGILLWQELSPEWKGTQAQYYRRLGQKTGEPSLGRTPLKIIQIHLPEFDRTDRCMTCHVGVDDPRMADEPQPFRTHPDLGIPGFLSAHSFREMGCTVCHHGQGSATIKEHAHGHVAHWEEPLLPKGLTVATCAACHEDVLELKGAERLVLAQALFEEKGCIGCHTLHSKGMLVGPELAETFDKSVDQFDFKYVRGEHTVINWVADHFQDPQRVVPGYPALGIPESAMPNYELSEEEVKLLTALVLSYAEQAGKEGRPIPERFKVPVQPKPEPSYASSIERGRAVFQKMGCAGCHGFEGRGGLFNKNMDIGEEVPSLIYVADGYTKEELKEVIRKGRYPAKAVQQEPSPPLWMPTWGEKIPEGELDALADYLLSLHPEAGLKSLAKPDLKSLSKPVKENPDV